MRVTGTVDGAVLEVSVRVQRVQSVQCALQCMYKLFAFVACACSARSGHDAGRPTAEAFCPHLSNERKSFYDIGYRMKVRDESTDCDLDVYVVVTFQILRLISTSHSRLLLIQKSKVLQQNNHLHMMISKDQNCIKSHKALMQKLGFVVCN